MGNNADMKLQLVVEAVNRFEATFNQLKSDLGQTGGALDAVAASSDKSNSSVSVLTGSLGGLKTAIAGVVAGLLSWKSVSIAEDAIMFAANAEQATRAMDVVANSTGRSASELEGWRDKIRDMNITTMAATGAVTQFARAQLPLEKLPMLASMAQGAAIMSTMTGRTLSSSEAFETMIRALITGQTVELHQLGLDVSRIEALRQMREETGLGTQAYSTHGMRLEELSMLIENNKNITDLYAKSQDLATKQIQSSKRPIEEMKLALGQLFLPELTEAATWFYQTVRQGMEYFRSADGKNALREWKTNILETFYEVKAEILRTGMLIDKLGGSLTSAGMLLYGPGRLMGNQNSTKQFEKMADANMEYERRYQEKDAELQRMADRLAQFQQNPDGKKYQDDPALLAKGLADQKAMREKEAEQRRLAAEQARIEAQREADAYEQVKRQAHEAYIAYVKAFDERMLAQLKNANALQLAALEDLHSQGLISEQRYLDDRLALEKGELTAELAQLEDSFKKIKAARDAAAAANKPVGYENGKPLYNAELLATENKTEIDYQNKLKEIETLRAKIAQADQKYGIDSAKAARDQIESIERLNVELLKLQGNEKAAVDPQIWLDYHKQLDAAVNGLMTAATPEEEKRYQQTVDYLVEIIQKKTEIAEISARAVEFQRREAEINHQLAQLDEAEKLREVSKFEAISKRRDLLEEILRLQEADLAAIDKVSNPQGWLTQQAAIDGTRQKLLELKLQARDLSDDMAGGFVEGMQQYLDGLGGRFKQMTDLAKATADGMQQAFSDFFFDAMQGKLKNLGDYITSFINSVQRAVANMLAQMAAEGLIKSVGSFFGTAIGGGSTSGGGGGGGSSSPGMVSSIFSSAHEGGLILHDGGKVTVPSFHFSGLASNEVPAILLKRERVLSVEQNKLFEKFVNKTEGGQGGVQVNVINPPGQQAEVEKTTTRFDGEAMIVNVVLKKLKADPSFRNALMTGGQ